MWARFGTFVGQPQINGELVWLSCDQSVELTAARGGRERREDLT